MSKTAMKIRIKDEEHSKAVQEKLFSMGYFWGDGEVRVQNTDKIALYTWDNDAHIMYSSADDDPSNFERDEAEEYVLHNGEIVPVEAVSEASTQIVDKPVVGDGEIPSGINPKQALGQASLPLNLFSPLATAYGCIGKLNGKLKYGLSNFVATPVIASIYADAIRRHLDKWMAGQEFDEADGVPHFAAMLANIDILLCARAAGTLVDDRPLLKGFEAEMEKLTPIVKALHELHNDKNPHHHLLSEKIDV